MAVIYIYALLDEHNYPRYVGKTGDLSRRFKQHLDEARTTKKSYKLNWLRSMQSRGLTPSIMELEKTSDLNANDLECFYISYLKYLGCELTNMTDGGDGVVLGTKRSEEFKQTLRKARNTGRYVAGSTRTFTPEHRAACSAARRGKPLSQTTKDKISAKARRRRVEQLDATGVVAQYDSLKNAAQHTGVRWTNIQRCCVNGKPKAGGYSWRFVDGD